MEWIKQHRQAVILLLVVLLTAAAVYVSALYRPGIWYDGVFLAQSQEGSRFASDDRSLELKKTTDGIRAVYASGEEQREYRITTTTRMTEMYEDGRLKFRGAVQRTGDSFSFRNQRGEPVAPADEGEFPDVFTVYTWIMEDSHDTRGNPWVLVVMGLFALVLAADLLIPRLVPSVKLPRSTRKTLAWAMGLGLAVLLILGFHHF